MAHANCRAALAGLIGALALAGPARADWTAYGGSTEHQLYTTERLGAPLGVLWKYATNTYAERAGNKGGPIIANGVVFFPSKNRLIAADAATGQMRWRMPDADAADPKIPSISATPATNGDFIYVPTADGRLSAYRCEDGAVVWQFQTGGAIHSSPTIVDQTVYFGSDDDYVYAINAKTGQLLWKTNERGKPTPLSDDAIGSPTYYAGVVYVNSADLKMWALDAGSGRVLWVQRTSAPSTDISPVVSNGKLFLAAGATIYQFRLRGGAYRAFPLQQWVESDITTTPIMTDKNWYFGDRNGYFHAFTPQGRPVYMADGKPWRVKLEGKPSGAPILAGDTIFVTTDRGFIEAIDVPKAKAVWTYRTEAPKGIDKLLSYYPLRAPLAVSGGKLYVLGDDGTLTCMAADAPDDEGPVITAPRPSRGAIMNGSPPLFLSAYLWDEGTGINPDTIEVLLDGQPIDPDPTMFPDRQLAPAATGKNSAGGNVVEHSTSPKKIGWYYDPQKRLLRYETPKAEEGQPEQPLLDGRHKVAVQAADWRGNFGSMEWDFIVDNTLPRGAVAVKPGKKGAAGQGGYPGDPTGGGMMPGMQGGMGGMAGPGGQQGNVFRGGQNGGYTYQNRGQNGYGFGGGRGGGLGGGGGFGGGRGGGLGGGGFGGGGRGGGLGGGGFGGGGRGGFGGGGRGY